MEFTEAEVYDSLGVEPDPAPELPHDGAETGREGAAPTGGASQPAEVQTFEETPANVKDGPPDEPEARLGSDYIMAAYNGLYGDFARWFARTYEPAQGYRFGRCLNGYV